MSAAAFPRLAAYGDGGFRFADPPSPTRGAGSSQAGGRREGSVLVVNGEVIAWGPDRIEAVAPEDLAPVLGADPKPDMVLVGAGPRMARLPEAAAAACRAAGVGVEIMDTGAACRVYATLVGEGRRFAAALIAVE